MDETAARLSAMIEKGKQALDIPETVPLDCVVSRNRVLSLSVTHNHI